MPHTNARHVPTHRWRLRACLLVAGGVFLFNGCILHHISKMDRKLIHRSVPAPPVWITDLPTDPDYFFSLGIGANASSLAEGRLVAARQALTEVTNYLRVRTDSRFHMVEATGLTTRIINELTLSSAATLSSSSLSQMYYEKYHHAGKRETANVYDVYILLRIPIKDIIQERARQAEKTQALLTESKATDGEAVEHFSEGNFSLAWQKWMLAMRLLDEAGADSVAMMQLYKTVLTAVEGIHLTWDTSDSGQLQNRLVSPMAVQATFSNRTDDMPLKGLLLDIRRSSGTHVQIKKTDSAGRVQYFFDTPPKFLKAQLARATYAVDLLGLSADTVQKVAFLERMLQAKVTRFGGAESPQETRAMASPAGTTAIAVSNSHLLSRPGFAPKLTLKVDIVPPEALRPVRAPLNLSVVIDRSASMLANGKLDYTKKAVAYLIDQLHADDTLSIVAYGSSVEVVMPSGGVSFKGLLKHNVSDITASGRTNLSGGLFEGYRQLRKATNPLAVNRLILLSDGIANEGITSGAHLIPYAEKFAQEGIAVSTLGVGIEYNESLLTDLANHSQGNYYYIKTPHDLPNIFAQELTQLSGVVLQNVNVGIELSPGVKIVNSYGHSSATNPQGGLLFRLGDLSNRGTLLLQLDVPPGVGEQDVARVTVTHGAEQVALVTARKISVVHTADAALVAASQNKEVERVRLVIHAIEQLERVLESQDLTLYQRARADLQQTYAKLEDIARNTTDPEFLQRMEFLKHFERKMEKLRASSLLHSHAEDAKKELGYQLYLQRHSHKKQHHPLHPRN